MNPFPPDDRMTVWFATNDRSRKVEEIRRNPRVALYYGNHGKAEGYAALYGKASIVTDEAMIRKLHRAYWDQAFPGGRHLALIKVEAQRVEVISYKHGVNNLDPASAAPAVDFGKD
jgi:general stress protein 26